MLKYWGFSVILPLKYSNLGKNPTPSAITVSSTFRGFQGFKRGKTGQLSVNLPVTRQVLGKLPTPTTYALAENWDADALLLLQLK